jgi:hypothetical protein
MYRIDRGNGVEPDMLTSDEVAMFPQPQFNTRDKEQICALDAENRVVPRDGETDRVGRVRCERVSGEFVYELHGRFGVPDEGPVVERALVEADEL